MRSHRRAAAPAVPLTTTPSPSPRLANKGFKKIYWTCLRQEPVVYVNGEPFTPREYSRMNENMQVRDRYHY